MPEIVRQGLVRVVCDGTDLPTPEPTHPRRTLGDLLVYVYADGTTYAAFREQRLARGREGIYTGPQASSKGVAFRCGKCGMQRRPRQSKVNEIGRALLDTPDRILVVGRHLPG